MLDQLAGGWRSGAGMGGLVVAAWILSAALPAAGAGPGLVVTAAAPGATPLPVKELKVAAARGEFELAMVRIEAPAGATLTAAELTLFAGPGAHRLPSPGRIYRAASGRGGDEDALLPVVDAYAGERRSTLPFGLAAGEAVTLWIELYVPRGTPAGRYEGELRIGSTAGAATVPIELYVLPLTLPAAGFVAVAAVDPAELLAGHPGAEAGPLLEAYGLSARRHRVALLGLLPPPAVKVAPATGELTVDWSSFDRAAAASFAPDPETGLLAPALSVPLPAGLSELRTAQLLGETAPHLRERGWEDRWVALLPPGPSITAQALSRASAKVRRVGGAREEGGARLLDAAGAMQLADAEPRLFWLDLTGLAPEPAPGALLSATRGASWAAFRLGASGLVFPAASAGFGRDPWASGAAPARATDAATLFYPGTARAIGGTTEIPVESVRLKLLRDGLEDREYLDRLGHLGLKASARRLAESLAADPERPSRDPEAYLAARLSAAEEISAREGMKQPPLELRQLRHEAPPAAPGFPQPGANPAPAPDLLPAPAP